MKNADGSCSGQSFGDTRVLCTAPSVPPAMQFAGSRLNMPCYLRRLTVEPRACHRKGCSMEIERLIGRVCCAPLLTSIAWASTITLDCDVLQADEAHKNRQHHGAAALHDALYCVEKDLLPRLPQVR